MASKWRTYWFLVLLWHKNEWIFVKTQWVHLVWHLLYTFRYTNTIINLYIVWCLLFTERLVNDLLIITAGFHEFLKFTYTCMFSKEEQNKHRKKETFICNRSYGPWTKLLYTIHNEIHGHVTMVNYLNWN